jgi:stage II sporulation protein D
VVVEGGGFGHGVGMSQNGANQMALLGKDYLEILSYFYPGTETESRK